MTTTKDVRVSRLSPIGTLGHGVHAINQWAASVQLAGSNISYWLTLASYQSGATSITYERIRPLGGYRNNKTKRVLRGDTVPKYVREAGEQLLAQLTDTTG